MVPFIIGLFIGAITGFIISVFIAGASLMNKEQEAYMEGFVDGQNDMKIKIELEKMKL